MSAGINVFLVCQQRIVLSGLERLFEGFADALNCIGTASSYPEARERLGSAPVDIALIDAAGADEPMYALIEHIQRELPATRVVLLAHPHDPAGGLDRAILGGARGVFDPAMAPAMLIPALQRIHEGEFWLDRQSTGRIFVELTRRAQKRDAPVREMTPFDGLTRREYAIVKCMAEHGGESNRQLANRLHVSESTLRNHLTAIYDKLGVANRNGMLLFAVRNGLGEHSPASSRLPA